MKKGQENMGAKKVATAVHKSSTKRPGKAAGDAKKKTSAPAAGKGSHSETKLKKSEIDEDKGASNKMVKNPPSSHLKTKEPSKPMKTKSASSSVASKKGALSSYLSRGMTDHSGDSVCREVACEGLATAGGYCRLHYIKNWKKIKRKEVILREKKLNQYIEELVVKYPDKYIEAIRQDLASDKDFAKVIHDLDLDEGVDDFDGEGGDQVDSLIDTIKRDFEDESDGF